MPPPAILSGLRVVEFSAFVAAPLAGATLASLGADVIRIEQCGGGVDARRWPVHEGRSLYREGLDRGKRSVGLDLRSTRGQELAAGLATAPGADAGIFVTNLGGAGWSSYESLARQRQDLIMLLIGGTPDGSPAVDYTVNAGLGFPLITGCSERPVNHVLPAWDVATGLFAALGILVADRHRKATGEGQLIDLALSDVALTIADRLGYLAEAQRVEEPRPRVGNGIFGSYGRDFTTSDGQRVMVAALTPRQWASLCEATSLTDEFATLEAQRGLDFRNEGARYACRHEISETLEGWFRERDLAEVRLSFEKHGVLWSPYRTFKELVRDDPRAAAPPPTPLRFPRRAPSESSRTLAIGSDTEDVLRDVLGVNSAEAAELRADRIIE